MKMNMTLLDMSWFPLESRMIPVHGGFLHIFTPPQGAKADYTRRLLAAMRERAVGAPFNLRPRIKLGGLPYWEEVEVDLDEHIIELRLPSPGTDSQLLAAAAEAIRRPLSWSLPLWCCHWIEGLEGGRFAFLLTVHHSQWDGMALFRLMGETMSESPQSQSIHAPWQGVSTWHAQALSSRKQGNARRSVLQHVIGLVRDSAAAAGDIGKVLSRQAIEVIKGSNRVALPMAAPESRPERNGSSERTYGLARFAVSRVKALAKSAECSFNDVMTAVTDAAYAAYLGELGIGTDKPLVAMVPIALKVAGAGNQLSGAMVTLGQPGSSPRERLAAISASMSTAKADIGAMSAAGAKFYAMLNMGIAAAPDLLRIGERLPTSANLLISNPYGVPKPLYLNGSRLDYFVPLIGPSLGTRLMVGIWSYAGETFVSLTSLRSVVPDVERLASLVHQAFQELECVSIEQPARKARA
ncbi:MAG: wax ester/triacylglycerol synthase domain-containing protein [Sinimarinibacterium sp.]|jgi:WS/DGAT/MGAT family acyltransferase